MPELGPAIELDHVTKRDGVAVALDDASLAIGSMSSRDSTAQPICAEDP
jgi:hypothetical protein